MDPPLRSGRACLHTAFIALSVQSIDEFSNAGEGKGGLLNNVT